MPKVKLRKKYYMVMSDNKNMGAFPFDPKGKKKALDYIQKLKKGSDSKFLLIEG